MDPTNRVPLSVLVVEDQDDCAQSTAELLSLYGHAVRVATCGPEALRDAARELPDVVLLDIQLPGPSGWEVAARLRERGGGRQPLVVAVTGCGSDEDRWRSADAGIDLHLVKPVAPADLVRLLDWVGAHLAARNAPSTACG